MTNGRSHLTKTLIVDKNGKLTTVHKKDVTSESTKSIPPVVSLPQERQDTALEFLLSVIPASSRYKIIELRRMRESSYSYVIDTAYELLTTGGPYTKKKLIESFNDKMGTLATSGDPEVWYPTIEPRLVTTWNVCEISDKVKIEPTDMAFKMVEAYDLNTNYPGERDLSYWQSLTLLSYAETPLDAVKHNIAHLSNLIELVRSEPNYKLLVDIIVERKITDVATIKELAAQQKETSSALHNGVL